jgi:hypothetical protein
MDIWIAVGPANAAALVRALQRFGFSATSLSEDPFLESNKVVRMGIPPLRIDLITSVAGLEFSPSFARRNVVLLDGVEVNLISPDDLKSNKRALGRSKDLDDLEHLP